MQIFNSNNIYSIFCFFLRQDSFAVDGVAFKKTFSYAGFEQQPKSFKEAKICLLNLELELKSEKENAEIRIDNPDVLSILNIDLFLLFIKN